MFRRGLRINSKIKELHQSLACCYSKIGDHDQAVATYSRIISQVDSSCGVTLLAIAGEYLRVDRPLLAGPYLDQYDMLRSPEARLKLRNCPFYCNELGVMMYQRKRYRESVRAFRSGFVAAQGSGTMIERVLIINGDMAALRSFYEARDPTSLFSLISQMMGRSEIYPLRWRALVYELAALILPVSTPSDVDDNRYRVQRRSLLNKAVECLTGAPPVPSSKIIGVSTIPRHLHRLLSILQS